MRLQTMRAELRRMRRELEFIDGQLDNEMLLESCDLAELTPKEIVQLRARNEKLMTQLIVLETMLETTNA